MNNFTHSWAQYAGDRWGGRLNTPGTVTFCGVTQIRLWGGEGGGDPTRDFIEMPCVRNRPAEGQGATM